MIKKTTATENGFCTEYADTQKVCSIKGEYERNSIKVNFYDGSSIELDLDVLTPYQEQYGILLSIDEKYVFVQDWDAGVFCYSIHDKSLIWKNKKKKCEYLMANDDALFAFIRRKGIVKFNLVTGEIIEEYKLPAEFFCQIDNDFFFIGPIKKKWFVMSVRDMTVLYEIPDRRVNPQNCISFIVNTAYIQDKKLIISGFEQTEEEMFRTEEMRNYEYTIDLQS